jgi:tRNA modification GTPase
VILRQILDRALQLGARLAEPGEFSLRALANQKINLSQAEAIRDLIAARTSDAAQQAVRQLEGELSSRLAPLKDRLLEKVVLLESALEFVEDDLPKTETEQVVHDLSSMVIDLDRLASTFAVGHLIAEGLRVVLIGSPNVGKSSLFNALLGTERAIVTDIPGTTRDSISEQITVAGVPIVLTDTAGVRAAGDVIETIGIERTHRAVADADMALVVLDGSREPSSEDQKMLDQLHYKPAVVAINKLDLPSFKNPFDGEESASAPVVPVSAITGEGLMELRTAILEPFSSAPAENSGLLITNARHYDLLRRAVAELESSLRLLEQETSEELVLVGLHNALRLLGQITGETTTEDILTRIFSTFCIGK